MKRCTYCGKEYPDDAVVCATDGQPLQPVAAPFQPPSLQYRPRKLLSYIAPVRAGVVLAIAYAFFGLIFAPLFILGALFGKTSGTAATLGGVFLAILFPVFYAVAGFLGGLIGAAVYNLVAKWTGGLEFEVRDAPPPAYYGQPAAQA